MVVWVRVVRSIYGHGRRWGERYILWLKLGWCVNWGRHVSVHMRWLGYWWHVRWLGYWWHVRWLG